MLELLSEIINFDAFAHIRRDSDLTCISDRHKLGKLTTLHVVGKDWSKTVVYNSDKSV